MPGARIMTSDWLAWKSGMIRGGTGLTTTGELFFPPQTLLTGTTGSNAIDTLGAYTSDWIQIVVMIGEIADGSVCTFDVRESNTGVIFNDTLHESGTLSPDFLYMVNVKKTQRYVRMRVFVSGEDSSIIISGGMLAIES